MPPGPVAGAQTVQEWTRVPRAVYVAPRGDRRLPEQTNNPSHCVVDRDRFEREVDRLMDRLYGTALRLTRHPEDAEDVVAEAVQLAWTNRAQLRAADGLEGWLFRILNNTFVSAWRRRRCRQDRETALDAGDEDDPEEGFSLYARLHQPFLLWWGTPEERFLNDLLAEDIQAAIDALPDAYRVVVVLVEVRGHTYEEVAELLELPLGTVRSRLNRGRSRLQAALWEQAREAGLVKAAPKSRARARKEASREG